MDIDLKNINISEIKDQITKLADKKTLIKIGIIAGAIVLFLIIYYAILNPMANSRKAKLKPQRKSLLVRKTKWLKAFFVALF